MKRGTRETLPYRLGGSLTAGAGMLLFAFPLAYGRGWWYALSGFGVALMLLGLGIIYYAVIRYGPDA